MTEPIPPAFLDLFKKKSFAYLATLMPDGTPQVTPIWIDHDGEHILINTAEGRLKDRNMLARSNIALTVQDPDDLYRHVSIRGHIVGVIEDEDGARDHINALSHRYRDKDFSFPAGQKRRIFKAAADKVFTEE